MNHDDRRITRRLGIPWSLSSFRRIHMLRETMVLNELGRFVNLRVPIPTKRAEGTHQRAAPSATPCPNA
jgi:hypothetical protein